MQIREGVIGDREQLIGLVSKFENPNDPILSDNLSKFRAFKNFGKAIAQKTEQYLTKPGYFVFVAENESVLKGFIVGKIIEKEYRVYYKEGYVAAWYVEKDYQGKGIGKQLFDSLVAKFENVGCTHIGLDTHLENNKAIQIYEHLGFNKRLVTFIKPLKTFFELA